MTDKVTVMVFKDNFAARTFQVPLSWISRLGLLLALMSLVTFYSAFLGIKYYRISRAADPTRLHDLELEIERLRGSYQQALDKISAAPISAAPAAQPTTIASAKSETPPTTIPSEPKQIATATTVAQPQAAIPATPIVAIAKPTSPTKPEATAPAVPAAPAKPVSKKPALPDRASLPIVISTPTVSWRNEILTVNFNIQYVSADGRNQQGHIVVLAGGPDRMLSYPSGVLNAAGSEDMIAPGRGEYFSVSHFREVNAELSGVRSPDTIKNVEIRIYDHAHRLMILEKVDLYKHPISIKDDSE